jgi:hypothetical protein
MNALTTDDITHSRQVTPVVSDSRRGTTEMTMRGTLVQTANIQQLEQNEYLATLALPTA